MAMEKQATTMAVQTILYVFDFPLAMWTSPWIVEFSRNSQNIFDAMLSFINYGLQVGCSNPPILPPVMEFMGTE